MMDLQSIKSDMGLMRAALEQAGVSKWLGNGRRQCRCPFHDDRNPSAGIHRANNGQAWLFTCCACGISTDVIGVVAMTRNMSAGDVLRHLHETGELLPGVAVQRTREEPNRQEPNFTKMKRDVDEWRWRTDRDWWEAVAMSLGVGAFALRLLDCVHQPRLDCCAFPMHDGDGKIIGIRYRWADGTKRAMTGSWAGLFLPNPRQESQVLWVCEGPTDCAALLSMGFWAVGLPAARQGIEHLARYIHVEQPRAVVSVADAGAVGRASASLVASKAAAGIQNVKVVQPPAKDVRAWANEQTRSGVSWEQMRQIMLSLVRAAKPVRRREVATV